MPAQNPSPKTHFPDPIPPPKGKGGIIKPGHVYKKTAGGKPIPKPPQPTGDPKHDFKMQDAYNTLYTAKEGGPKTQPNKEDPLYGYANPKGVSAAKGDTTIFTDQNPDEPGVHPIRNPHPGTIRDGIFSTPRPNSVSKPNHKQPQKPKVFGAPHAAIPIPGYKPKPSEVAGTVKPKSKTPPIGEAKSMMGAGRIPTTKINHQ